ncbi:hypothetical protein [Xenorhabdus thuongxuanensis]|uniref:DUF7823 domain-containing protein n=1 Tax=Xenorhabdus thuongxuanensis TaxID=1873484 RepID=A0A1Q5U8I5_9GAMM|nr:hypothetical protein [Xenorhabdus thuongxuanensis]OKP08797.1 hypothetical protein Xentx_00468 [Xenorhabdus thuongxuanensis]
MSDVNKLKNCMLSFDLNIGATPPYIGPEMPAKIHLFGYLADMELRDAWPFGTLTNFQNETDIAQFSYFSWDDDGMSISIRVSSDNNQAGYQKMVELFNKDLIITVNDTNYNLGRSADDIYFQGKQQYEFVGSYNGWWTSDNDDIRNLGFLLKENINNTLHFCFNWK